MARTDRNSITHLVRRGLRKPRLVVPYVRRRLRNRRLRAGVSSHPEFYRRVMASDVRAKTARGAVGTPGHDRWLALGKLQFDYLTGHGLEPSHHLLEIGCGNLRAGWRFVEYLEPGRYTGVDISPDILLAAEDTVVEYGLQEKRPALFLVDGTNLDFLPENAFDVIHAHSVFSHTPVDVIEEYLRQAKRLMRPGAFFDFTFNEAEGEAWGFLDEDFYYPAPELQRLAAAHGFEARLMDGWEHPQRKIRLVRPAGAGADA